MLRQRFPSAFDKLDRAEAHADALRAAVAEYKDSEPVTLQHAKEGGGVVYRVVSFRAPPDLLSCIAGDALQNARAALEHLVCALAAEKSQQRPGDEENIGLPVCEQEADFRAAVRGLRKRIEPADVAVLDGADGFRGGRPGLWELHKLAIIDRHRALIVPLAVDRQITITLGTVRPRAIQVVNDRVRVGMRVLSIESDVPYLTPPILGPEVRVEEPAVFGRVERGLVEVVEETIGAARDVIGLFGPW